jgi:5-(hydroxymethyl)furfural/furfural oxidase
MASFRRLAALHALPELQAVTSDVFAASYSDKVRAVGEMTAKNRITTAILARLLDGPAALRRKLINSLIVEGDSLEVLLRDDDALEAFVRRAAVGVWHASCTCRMGAEDDPMAVTDTQGRVHGLAGLRVCDASIFPVVPRANTNVPVLMAAEKIADTILAGTA